MNTRGPLVAAACLVVASLGCPRPLASPASAGGAPRATHRVPRDTVVELTLTDLPRGRALLGTLLALVDAERGLMPGARAGLARVLGLDPLDAALSSLAAVDDQRPITLARRRGGSLHAFVPSVAPNRTLAALAASRGAVAERAATPLGVQRVVDENGEVFAHARVERDGLALAFASVDPLGDAALLAARDDPALHRAARPIDVDRAASFAISRAGLVLDEERASGEDPIVVTGSFDVKDGALSLTLSFEDGRTPSHAPWRAGCALVDAAVLRARLPATLLARVLGDEERLVGDVEILALPREQEAAVDGAPDDIGDLASAIGLVIVGRPRDADAARSLKNSIVDDADAGPLVIARGATTAGRSVAAFVDDERFLLSTRGEHDVRGLVDVARCDRGRSALFVDGARARAALARPADAVAVDDAGAALRRMLARAFASIRRIEAAPSEDGRALEVALALEDETH